MNMSHKLIATMCNIMLQEFTVSITEEFTEHLYDGALSIEVYGHSSEEGLAVMNGRSLADRWSEVMTVVFPVIVILLYILVQSIHR